MLRNLYTTSLVNFQRVGPSIHATKNEGANISHDVGLPLHLCESISFQCDMVGRN